MRKLILFALILGLASLSSVTSQTSLSAKEIVKTADEKFKGKTSKGELVMTIIRPKWTRSYSIKSWTKGNDYALVLITAPVRDKGQTFLKRGTEMWNWLPNISRMVKLPPSVMSQGWMDSDYTNDDILKKSSLINDYSHEIVGNETIDGHDCYKIKLLAVEDSDATWGAMIMWISKKDFLQMKIEYYDEDEELVKTDLAYNVKLMDDRKIPTKMEIIPADEPDKKTIVEIKNMEFDREIPDSFFSQQKMKTVK